MINPDGLPSREEERHQYRKLSSRFSVSHMSNTKWRRVFGAIATAGIETIRSEWKHIDGNYICQHNLMPGHADLLECRFKDGCFQPYEYKWIQWIRFPRSFFDDSCRLTRDQDLSHLEAALVESRAVTVIDNDSVTIVAYDNLIDA